GFDCHRFMEDESRPLMIGGMEIASPLALEGHSDADVVLHAITDAMLGTIGDADIGQHFSPNDPRWKDADSSDFIRHALSLLSDHQATLTHVDVTIIGEEPKISPHREAMRQTIAALLGLEVGRVSIKATTTE